MTKIIHYCWFGGKPLPKSARKYIKSWQKYMPEFEIKEWNESNFDINECEFVKQAYENKKWAFVSDYVRMKVLYENGGMYLDTDMEIVKKVDDLLEHDFFIGREDSGYIAAGVIWVKEKENKHIGDILKFYQKQKVFDTSDLFKYAIPKVITEVLSKYDKVTSGDIDIIDNSVYVYSSEYFYPINYDYSKREFTPNTCMIHYYNAVWVPKTERITISIYRKIGVKKGRILIKTITFPYKIVRKLINKCINIFKNLNYKAKMVYSIYFNINRRNKRMQKRLEELKNYDYMAIHHPDWLGVSNSTKDLFESTFEIRDVYTEKEAKKIAELICNSGKKLVIFSGFAKGYSAIIENINRIDSTIKVKVLWHGSNALLVETPDWIAFNLVLMLYKQGKIEQIGFVKKSLYEFFKMKKYNVAFVMNLVNIDKNKIELRERTNVGDNKFKFGLYSSLDRWIKNTYNQISAISLFENSTVDITPMGEKSEIFAHALGLDTTGSSKVNVSRSEILSRMSSNDVNVYVTFTECSPMIPLESLEVGVPCITGDNHHYFENTELEKYLVVNKEDNIVAIHDKLKLCLENREKIIELYKTWKIDYEKIAKESVVDFLNS